MRWNLLLATLLGVGLLAPAAVADEAAEREARVLFGEGNKLAADGEWATALLRFRAAYRRWPNPKILPNIGTMLRQLARNAEAGEAYALYLRDPAADPAKRREVELALAEVDAKIARVRLVVDDPAATVRVDGKELARGSALEVRLEPGPHVVTAELEGAPPAVVNLTVRAGQHTDVPVRIGPAGAPSTPAAPVAPTPDPGVPAAPPPTPSLSHARQLGVLARVDIDGTKPGVAPVLGLAYGIGSLVELTLVAVMGRRGPAVEPGTTLYFLSGAWKPRLSLSVPVFILAGGKADGLIVAPGIHGAAGVQWDPIRHFGVFLDVGVAGFPSAPTGFDKVVFLPALGVQARL